MMHCAVTCVLWAHLIPMQLQEAFPEVPASFFKWRKWSHRRLVSQRETWPGSGQGLVPSGGAPRLMGVSAPVSWAAHPLVGQGWGVVYTLGHRFLGRRELWLPRREQANTLLSLLTCPSVISPSLSSACFSHRSIHTPVLASSFAFSRHYLA